MVPFCGTCRLWRPRTGPQMTQNTQKHTLLFFLDQAFGRRGWHGPTLSAALRGVTPAEARWIPSPGRNSIWQLALHAAFWKHEVRRRLAPTATEPFPRAPANFPGLPKDPTAAAWKADVTLLKNEQTKLVKLVRRFPAARLSRRFSGTPYVPLEQIAGIAAHDLYHCGQVTLIRKLYAAL